MNRQFVVLLIPMGIALAAFLLELGVRRRGGAGGNDDENRFRTDFGVTLPAGYSLLKRMAPMLAGLQMRAALAVTAPFALWAGFTTIRLYDASVADVGGLVLLVAAGGLLELFLVSQYRRTRRRYAAFKSGYEAKLVTAQALAASAATGDFICHEFSRESLWIDHILVSSKGIFAIQSHPGGDAGPGNPGDGRIVTYDGRQLFFGRQDVGDDVVSRADEAAEQMSAWLSAELDTPVAVRAIVSIPGWTVKRTSADGISVINPDRFGPLLQHISPWSLSSAEIDNVVDIIKAAY